MPKLLKISWGYWRRFLKPEFCFGMALTFEGRSSVSWRWRAFTVTQ
jgi:hypothetical protein